MIFERDLIVWEDGAGAAKSVTGSYADSGAADPWFGPYEEANYILFDFLLSAGVPTTIEFQLIWTPDDGTEVKGSTGAVIDVNGAVTQIADGSFQLTSVVNGHHTACIAIPPGIGFKLQMKYTGGSAPDCITKVVIGCSKSLGGAAAGSGGGGGGGSSPNIQALYKAALPSVGTDGSYGDLIANLYGQLMSSAFDILNQADRTTRENPEHAQLEGDPIVDVTNGVSTNGAGTTYDYYFSPRDYGKFTLRFDLDGGVDGGGDSGITVKIYATWQDDGTAKESITRYEDLSTQLLGGASYVVANGATGSLVVNDNSGICQNAIWVHIELVVSANTGTADWAIDKGQRYI